MVPQDLGFGDLYKNNSHVNAVILAYAYGELLSVGRFRQNIPIRLDMTKKKMAAGHTIGCSIPVTDLSPTQWKQVTF